MSSPEFTRWIAYYNIEPFGEERADLRAGVIASTYANIHLKKGVKRLTPGQFMPDFGKGEKKRRVMSAEELWAQFKLITIAKGGTIVKAKK